MRVVEDIDLTKKFAVNIMGSIIDAEDKYDAKDIEELLDRQAVTDCFKPFKIFGVAVKEIPLDGPTIEKKKVSIRRVKLKR
jgi:hypothetical protein